MGVSKKTGEGDLQELELWKDVHECLESSDRVVVRKEKISIAAGRSGTGDKPESPRARTSEAHAGMTRAHIRDHRTGTPSDHETLRTSFLRISLKHRLKTTKSKTTRWILSTNV